MSNLSAWIHQHRHADGSGLAAARCCCSRALACPSRSRTPRAVAVATQSEARAYFDKATASFALGHYPVAAENFEKAFELKPDPALLYNAAQAHRLAGNKERALTLYQNYLRLYAKAVRRSEVETRVEELKKAIERDRQLATSPPTTTMPSALPPGPPASDPTVGRAPAPVASLAAATSGRVAATTASRRRCRRRSTRTGQRRCWSRSPSPRTPRSDRCCKSRCSGAWSAAPSPPPSWSC